MARKAGSFRLDHGWSWVILVAAFLCNIIFDGLIFSFGVFKFELTAYYEEGQGPVAWVGATISGVYGLVGPIASMLANRYGCRAVTVGGSLLATVGFLASTFSPNIWVMMVTYGILGGIGFGMMYHCAYVMIGHYFEKRRALATGIASCGSGVGTFLFAPLSDLLLRHYGWRGAMWIMSGIVLNGVVMGAVFRPAPTRTYACEVSKEAQGSKPKRKLVSPALLRSPAFFIFCTSSFFCLVGFMVPFIYLPDVALAGGFSHEQAIMLVSVIGLTNTAGRIVCGWVSDKAWADPLKIYNVALIVGGVSSALCTWFSHWYAALITYAAVFGVCVAAYVSLCAIILIEFLGLENLSSAFGFLNFFRGIATLIGAPLAGFLYDSTQSFSLPFYVAGASIATAGLICLPLRVLSRCCQGNARAGDGHIRSGLDIQLNVDDLKTLEANSQNYEKMSCQEPDSNGNANGISKAKAGLLADILRNGFTGSMSSIAGFVSPSPSLLHCGEAYPEMNESSGASTVLRDIKRRNKSPLDDRVGNSDGHRLGASV